MKLTILALTLICGLVLADNTVKASCHQCGQVACLVMTGGGFTGKDIPTEAVNCSEAGEFPLAINFKCERKQCSEGCLLTQTAGGRIVRFCSSTDMGTEVIAALNILYSIQEGD